MLGMFLLSHATDGALFSVVSFASTQTETLYFRARNRVRKRIPAGRELAHDMQEQTVLGRKKAARPCGSSGFESYEKRR
jgi:hypothetical protein